MLEFRRKRKKNAVTEKEIDRLLELYYEGLTTASDESLLRAWLSQPDIPSRFDADKALFGYFAGQKKTMVNKGTVLRMTTWFSVAAAILFLLLLTEKPFIDNGDNYVYIQGKKYTSLVLVKEKAHSTLSMLSDSQDEVSKSAALLNGENILQEQLKLLDGYDF